MKYKRICSSVRWAVRWSLRQLGALAVGSTLMACGATQGSTDSPAPSMHTQEGTSVKLDADPNAGPKRVVRVEVTIRSVADSGEERVLSSMQRRLMEGFPLVLDAEISTPGGGSSRVGAAVESSWTGDDACLRGFWTLPPDVNGPPVSVCGKDSEASLHLEQELAPGFRVSIEIRTDSNSPRESGPPR
jgi:hypothetical protein